MTYLAILCLAALAGFSSADSSGLYGAKSAVLSVDSKNYNSLIAQSNHTSVLEFYAPWCGHCQNLKPAYEKAAKNLAGLAKVAAINCDEDANKAFCGQFGVQGFPTLKIVRPGKKPGKPVVEDYQGPREAKAIVEAVTDKISNHVKRLKSDTLDEWIKASERPKAILFTEKGITAPLVKALAIDFLGSIDFAQIRNKEAAAVDKFEISEFPTVVVLNGDKTSKYDGKIDKESLMKFLSQFASPNPDPAPKKAKPKPTGTKKATHKSSSVSSAFSKASTKQKSSEFDDYLEHAGTVVLDDDVPTGSPSPIVDHKQKPMVVPDVAPSLPTVEAASELQNLCLQPTSGHCILVLLPEKESTDLDYAPKVVEAMAAFAILEEKYKRRKTQMFPAYAIPASNTAASNVREAFELKPNSELDVIVLNMKRGWAKKYSKDGFEATAVESFLDDIRFGEGSKQKIAKDLFVQEASDDQGSSASTDSTSGSHDEL